MSSSPSVSTGPFRGAHERQPAHLVDVAAETVRDEHLGEMVNLRSLRLLGRLLDLIDGRLPPPLEEVVVVVLFTAPAVKKRCSHLHWKKQSSSSCSQHQP